MSSGDTDDGAEQTGLPREIGRTALRVLAHQGYTSLDQLTEVTADRLLEIHGVGPKAVRILGEHLAARSLTFANRR